MSIVELAWYREDELVVRRAWDHCRAPGTSDKNHMPRKLLLMSGGQSAAESSQSGVGEAAVGDEVPACHYCAPIS